MPFQVNPANLIHANIGGLAEGSTTQTATQVVADQNEPKEDTTPSVDPKVKKRNDEFRTRKDLCKLYRRKLIANWTISIDYRRGKPFSSQTDEDQVAVNLDWVMTKAKVASLFSQVPEARIDHSPQTLPKGAPWCAKFESMVNANLKTGGIESVMEEVLPNTVNAAGFGAAIVSYQTLTEDRQVAKQGQDTLEPGAEPEMETVPYVLDKRYVVESISPADFLWPINFTGADFDNAPWIGRSGRITWADAVNKFNLAETDKEAVLGEDRAQWDKLTHDVERDKAEEDRMVGFDEIFFKEFAYDPEAKSYSTIHHLVFVAGKDDPVIDEPWKGQKVLEDGSVIGATRYPIQVLTLSYLTDEAIPPSDSAIGRPQVNEINKARTQMIRQRERSLPIRWFDVNRVDPAIQQGLMRGTWQAMIPVQGNGERVIGEVARAQMPQENFLFDKIAKTDLDREWTMGQLGNQDDTAAPGEPEQNARPFNTQSGKERARVGSFFCRLAEIMGGLMCLYEDPQVFGEGFDQSVSKLLKFSILADSTVLLDASQKLARLNQFVNTYAKSGWVNIEPVLQEIATLTGLDPNVVIQPPQPKPPVEPNISLRLTGVEDLLNPLVLAFLMKSGQAPEKDLIEQAKDLIQQAVVPPQGMDMNAQPNNMAFPMLPEGAAPPSGGPNGSPVPPPPGAPLPPPSPAPPKGAPLPSPAPPKVGEAHPQWQSMDKIMKRTESGGKQ